MKRQELIDKGKLYQVHEDDSPDTVIFEGTKTACETWARQMFGSRALRYGNISIGKLIWEREDEPLFDRPTELD